MREAQPVGPVSRLWPVIPVEFVSANRAYGGGDGPPGMFPVARAELGGQSFAYWWSDPSGDPSVLTCDDRQVARLGWFHPRGTALGAGSARIGISGRVLGSDLDLQASGRGWRASSNGLRVSVADIAYDVRWAGRELRVTRIDTQVVVGTCLGGSWRVSPSAEPEERVLLVLLGVLHADVVVRSAFRRAIEWL